MKIEKLPYELTVAQYETPPKAPKGFFSLSSAQGEISLVCETKNLPLGATAREDGWRAFMLAGPMDFSLVGVLSEIASVLASNEIPIFALSTFDTDYILVKEEYFSAAAVALSEARHEIL